MKHIALAALLATTPVSAIADSEADIKYIVDQTVTRAIFEGALAALRPVLLSAVENDLRSNGVTVSDIGAYMDILMEEFMAGYIDRMKDLTAAHYLTTFSPTELSDIASFYASQSGQVLIKQTPGLMQFGASAGAAAGQQAFVDARPRVRQRLIDENIDVTRGDKSMMQKLLDALK